MLRFSVQLKIDEVGLVWHTNQKQKKLKK